MTDPYRTIIWMTVIIVLVYVMIALMDHRIKRGE